MVQQTGGMTSNLESIAPTSFTARRSAASNLPNFELPPPPLAGKFPPLSTNTNQPSQGNFSVGNLLTPPSNIPGDSLSPISSGTNSSGATAASQGLPPYTPNGFWSSGSGLTPLVGLGTGNTPQPWAGGQSNNLFPPRGLFSPSLNSMLRNNNNSPNASDNSSSQSQSYDYNQQLPPFATSMSMSQPGTLPALMAQQQQAMSYMNNNNNNVHTPISAVGSQPSPVNQDGFMQRPPPTPTYYGGSQSSGTPQQGQFPSFTSPSPTQQSPMSAGLNSRISPSGSQPNILQPSPSQPMHTFSRPFNPYPLPAMSGPILSNLQNPGGQMSLVGVPGGLMGGFNSGHAAQMQMYGNQQQQPHNDRPFKCDQCPQSFNRNHDLKRHKRIHLAVKPFPCGHCEKSFSRKDALKVRS